MLGQKRLDAVSAEPAPVHVGEQRARATARRFLEPCLEGAPRVRGQTFACSTGVMRSLVPHRIRVATLIHFSHRLSFGSYSLSQMIRASDVNPRYRPTLMSTVKSVLAIRAKASGDETMYDGTCSARIVNISTVGCSATRRPAGHASARRRTRRPFSKTLGCLSHRLNLRRSGYRRISIFANEVAVVAAIFRRRFRNSSETMCQAYWPLDRRVVPDRGVMAQNGPPST